MAEKEDRIVYDAQALIRRVEDGLEELKRFRYDNKYRSLLGDRFVEKIADWDSRIRARKDDPFTLVVCGDFKRGKSSLINALLGEEVAPVNVTTETVTLNRIRYGNHGNEALLSGGRKMILSDEELQKEQIRSIMEKTGETISYLNIRRPIPILKDITVIDTPGLGDAFRNFDSLVGEALAQADAVIYVFSVEYPLSQQEQMFLKTTVLPQRYTELFLVGNFADTISNAKDMERVRKMLQKRIDGLLFGKKPYLISALDERCRLLGAERSNEALAGVLEENFADLRREIEGLIEDKKEYVLPERMERLFCMMQESLNTSLDSMEKGLTMDEESIRQTTARLHEEKEKKLKLQEELEKQVEKDVSLMKTEAMTWLNEAVNRMEAEVDTLKDMDASLLIKYYSFYCVDVLQQAVNQCVERHQEELYDKLEEVSAGLAKGFLDGREKTVYHFRFALDNKTWTKGDNVSYVASQFNFGLLSTVADGLAGAMRQKEIAKKTPELLDMIHQQYSGVRQSIRNIVEETYSNMKKQAVLQLRDYYDDQIADAQAQVEECARIAGKNKDNKQEVLAAMREVREVLFRMETGESLI